MDSLFLVAKFLGVISPNMRIRKVRIPVARPMSVLEFALRPLLEARWIARVVVRDEAERLTILFCPATVVLYNCL